MQAVIIPKNTKRSLSTSKDIDVPDINICASKLVPVSNVFPDLPAAPDGLAADSSFTGVVPKLKPLEMEAPEPKVNLPGTAVPVDDPPKTEDTCESENGK